MFVIVCMASIFSDDIRKIAFSNNNINSFKEYKVGEENNEVLLPEIWSIESQENNIDGKSLKVKIKDNNSMKGEIIILDSKKDIEVLSDEVGNEGKNRTCYSINENNDNWKIIYYENNDNKTNYKNKCYLKKYSEGKILMITFKFKEADYKPSINVTLDEIAKTFR
ncbi:hypothetical protein [Clostridium carnis]